MRGYSVPRPEPPPVMVTGAQFMYISRFPILLNHVLEMLATGAEWGFGGGEEWNVAHDSPRKERSTAGGGFRNGEAEGAAVFDGTGTYYAWSAMGFPFPRKKELTDPGFDDFESRAVII